MANNESDNKRPPNTRDIGARLRGQWETQSATEKAEEEKIANAERMRQTGIEGIAGGLPEPFLTQVQRMVNRKESDLNRWGPRQETRQETKTERYTRQAQNEISRTFNVNGQISDIARSSRGQQMSLGSINMAPEQVESRRGAINEELSRLEASSVSRAPNIFGNPQQAESARRKLAVNEYKKTQLMEEAGGLEATSKAHRILGIDPASKRESLLSAVGATRDRAFSNSAEVKAVSQLGPEEFAKRQAKAAEELEKTFKELTEAGANASKALLDAAAAAEKEVRTVEAGGAAGGGGPGNTAAGKMLAKAAPWLEAGIAVAGAVGHGVQQIGVNQSIAVRHNQAGLAGLENQKYDMYKKARGGDVASQMLLGEWKDSEKFGSNVKTAQNVATGSNMLANAGSAILSGLKGAAIGAVTGAGIGAITGAGIGAIPGAILGGIAGGAMSLSNVAVGGSDIARGVSGDQAKIAATQADMDAKRAINAIPAEQLQGFRDFSTGMGTVARSMGGKGGAFLKGIQGTGPDNGMLQDLAKAGLSPQQAVEMAQYGVQNMGSTFDKDQIFAARGLEQSGVGTKEENMTRMAMLAGAGSNNPKDGLAGVLEASFGKSLDSAKSLTALVSNTGEMARNSVAGRSGFDATGATATILAANIDGGQANREVALERARSAAETADEIVTDKSVNFTNMAKISRIQKMTGMGGEDAVYAAGLDLETLGTLAAEKDPRKRAEALRAQGVNATDANSGQIIADLRKAAGMSILGKGTIAQSGVNTETLYQKIMSGEKLNEQEQLQAGRAAKQGKFASAGDMERAIRSTTAVNEAGAAGATKDQIAGTAGSKELKDADKLLTGGFKQLSEAAASAASQLGGAAKAMEQLVKMQEAADKEGGAKGEGEFSKSGKKAAESTWFSDGAKTFNTAAIKWHDIAIRLEKVDFGKTTPAAAPPPPAGDTKR